MEVPAKSSKVRSIVHRINDQKAIQANVHHRLDFEVTSIHCIIMLQAHSIVVGFCFAVFAILSVCIPIHGSWFMIHSLQLAMAVMPVVLLDLSKASVDCLRCSEAHRQRGCGNAVDMSVQALGSIAIGYNLQTQQIQWLTRW
jgi:hypothetical protein